MSVRGLIAQSNVAFVGTMTTLWILWNGIRKSRKIKERVS